jgi:hypothetical protein
MMIERRFEKIADGAFYDQPNGILIFDLFPRNAIQTEEGDVLPIDPVIQRISPDFAQFLRENPNTINSRP